MGEAYETYLQTRCRTCLDVESYHVGILEDVALLQKLDSCLSIKVSPSDDLPKVICINCASKLNDFYNFQVNSYACQDWLSTAIKEHHKKGGHEVKTSVQPIANSEYNSDSLLEFLNNTDNVEEYLNTLGSTDLGIQSFAGLFDHDSSVEIAGKKHQKYRDDPNMEIDFLESEADIVNELLKKEQPEPKQKDIICLACKQNFRTIELLSQHLLVCDSTPRTCFHCGLLFDSKRQMLIHRLSHSIGPDATCETCGEKYPDKKLLLKHYNKCHIDFLKAMGCSYKCKICDQKFLDRAELFKHAKKHIPKNSWYCDVCEKSYSTKSALEAHKEKMHNDGKTYSCKVCGFTASVWSKLIVHVRKHSALLELEQHLCDYCGQSFTTKAALNRHVLRHVGDRHKCRHCQKECVDELTLRKHLAMHEKESVMCEFCGATFLKFDFLVTHLKTVHQSTIQINDS